MNCPECGYEKEIIVRVYRGKRYDNGRWLVCNSDTRESMCVNCGSRYYTETKHTHHIIFNKQKQRREIKGLELR